MCLDNDNKHISNVDIWTSENLIGVFSAAEKYTKYDFA